MSVYENVTVVVYVVDISQYHMMLYEDESKNRILEAIDIWNIISASRYFSAHSHMLLVLNKIDLFTEQLKLSPLRNYFPAYSGDNSPESAIGFLRELFLPQNPRVRLDGGSGGSRNQTVCGGPFVASIAINALSGDDIRRALELIASMIQANAAAINAHPAPSALPVTTECKSAPKSAPNQL